ncbi:hypothetical protein E1A91_A07G085800v1 [Gossypium mustelinum]|uniref:Uncharacterized protein n=1 Tax=Gossypium mustelinum TaxID=34275 RepID=A0A5D2YHS3_GOSMU|nr:hypothetical protein E1A91_A07G085800v1 [Gossypium mustelinum]
MFGDQQRANSAPILPLKVLKHTQKDLVLWTQGCTEEEAVEAVRGNHSWEP